MLSHVLLIAALGAAPVRAAAPARETVYLIHGMGRTPASLWVLAKRLRGAGYATALIRYNHAARSLDEISDSFRERVRAEAPVRYHVIGHSLGGIIVRNAFKKGLPPGFGRFVMLAPPNSPAGLAAGLKDNPLYKLITGDSGQKLAQEEFYRTLPVPSVEFAVIAGDRGSRLASPEPNDGIVTVAGTKLDGMRDFRVVHHTHTFIMNGKDTFELCRRFLKEGKF